MLARGYRVAVVSSRSFNSNNMGKCDFVFHACGMLKGGKLKELTDALNHRAQSGFGRALLVDLISNEAKASAVTELYITKQFAPAARAGEKLAAQMHEIGDEVVAESGLGGGAAAP